MEFRASNENKNNIDLATVIAAQQLLDFSQNRTAHNNNVNINEITKEEEQGKRLPLLISKINF